MLFEDSLTLAVALFAASALLIGYFGLKMTYIARDLAQASVLVVHPISLLLIIIYPFTVKMLVDTHQRPM